MALQEDHRRLLKIFDLIDQELQAVNDGREPDVALLSDILAYITYYPDFFHQPLEEFIFDCLLRHEELRPVVEFLRAEHLKLAKLTTEFREAVAQLHGAKNSGSRDRVVTLGAAYVVAQRSHMAAEENAVFPQASSLLTEDEWNQVQEYVAETSPMEDPVFGPSVQARYRVL